MMAYSEDHIALAAEYALGTLDADERAQVETMMSVDKDFTAMVTAWEQKLGVLNQMVGSVEPRPEVWEKIRAAVGLSEPQAPLVLPEAPPPVAARRRCRAAAVAESSNVIRLSQPGPALAQCRDAHDGDRRRPGGHDRGPGFTGRTCCPTAFAPSRGRRWSRSGPRRRRRRRMPNMSPCCRRMVARLPSFSRWMGRPRISRFASVGAAAEPGKSFELWLISDKLPQPRSLGVIGGGDFTARPVLASYDADTIKAATYAVTVEQAGGSPDGKPTSAPVFAGKLIETVPPAAAPAPSPPR